VTHPSVDIHCNDQCRNCNKWYKTHAGLWKHLKICEAPEEEGWEVVDEQKDALLRKDALL
jgi:benzoyl-CoA reductase/2-hydroxyglutaryl-CoA dehydratase subunit BcrC/BadD/HgdB